MQVLAPFIILAIIAVVVSVIPMNPTFKSIAYIIIGIAVVLALLPLIGIHL